MKDGDVAIVTPNETEKHPLEYFIECCKKTRPVLQDMLVSSNTDGPPAPREEIYGRNVKATKTTYKKKITVVCDIIFDLDFKEVRMLDEMWKSKGFSRFTKQSCEKSWSPENAEFVRKFSVFQKYLLESYQIPKSGNKWDKFKLNGTDVPIASVTDKFYNAGGCVVPENTSTTNSTTKVSRVQAWFNCMLCFSLFMVNFCRLKESSGSFLYRINTEWKLFYAKTELLNIDTDRDVVSRDLIFSDQTQILCWKKFYIYRVKETLSFEVVPNDNNFFLFMNNLDKVLLQIAGCIFNSWRMTSRLENYLVDIGTHVYSSANFEIYDIPIEVYSNTHMWNNMKYFKIQVSDINNSIFKMIKKASYIGNLPSYDYDYVQGMYKLNDNGHRDFHLIHGFDFKLGFRNLMADYRSSLRFLMNKCESNPRRENILQTPFASSQFMELYNSSATHMKECAICLENMVPLEKLAMTTCGHLFHTTCFEHAYKIKKECPICKFK